MNSQLAIEKISKEESLRAEMYQFLSGVLQSEPSEQLIKSYYALKGDDTPIGTAFGLLSKLSNKLSVEEIRSEYLDLFIGVGRGELLPFGSYYLTGFLHDKPLAKLRKDLHFMGIQKEENNKDPEDHIACLSQVMSGLITGAYGRIFSIAEQRSFFRKHLQPWAEHFFTDLEGAKTAVFYCPVGTIGRLFIEIEVSAFEMEASR